jgi:hypothetical protein
MSPGAVACPAMADLRGPLASHEPPTGRAG